MKNRKSIYLSIVSLLNLVLLFVSCSANTENHSEEEKNKNEHEDEIIFSHEQAEKSKIKIEEIKLQDFEECIKVGGKIEPVQGYEQTVTATASGIISINDKIANGYHIGTGNVIAKISGGNIEGGNSLKKTAIEYEKAYADFQRAEKLIEDKIISEKEFLQTKSNYELAKNAYLFQQKNSDNGMIIISSPLNGYIKNIFVKTGDYVETGTAIATISNTRKLKLTANVSECHYSLLPHIKSAQFKTAYDNQIYDIKKMNGRLISAGTLSDETSHSVPVSFEFDNIGNLIAGSYVETYLYTGTKKNSIVIPASALTEEQGFYFVYLRNKEEDDAYIKQEVTLGGRNIDSVEILSGIKPGDLLVCQGAYHIKLASGQAAPEGHSHNH